MLNKIVVKESCEEVVETRSVTATFDFTFVDGFIQDAEMEAFYQLIAPKAPVVPEHEQLEEM